MKPECLPAAAMAAVAILVGGCASHKWITIVSADEIPWFREGHTRSFRIDDAKFLAGSGLWSQLSDTRLELPIVAVEPVANRTYQGYQLGGGQWCRTTVVLHVLAEDSATANRISNALSFQAGPAIFMYDSHMVQQSGAFALDYRGALTSNPTIYPNLIKMIRMADIYIIKYPMENYIYIMLPSR